MGFMSFVFVYLFGLSEIARYFLRVRVRVQSPSQPKLTDFLTFGTLLPSTALPSFYNK